MCLRHEDVGGMQRLKKVLRRSATSSQPLSTQRPFSFPMDIIAKVDVVTGKQLLFQEEGLSLGEAVFIQDPNDSKVR